MTQPAWTYSQLDGFESCPKKFYHLKVLRDIKEPPTVHTEWGKTVHTAFEEAVLHGTQLPAGMTQWQGIADRYISLPGDKYAEYKFAINKDFQLTGWQTAWSRGIADLVVVNDNVALVADWKTGKRKPTEQLELYAAYIHAWLPEVTTIHTHFVWLKEKKIDKYVVPVAEIPRVWQSLLPRVNKLESAYKRDSWPARPSGLCRGWCPVKTCTHWKEKR